MEFVGIEPEVIDELIKGRRAREVMEMSALKASYQRLAASPEGEHRSADVLGRPVLSVPPLAYHYWGQREGYDCWKDKKFRKEYARDNPGAKVASSGGTKVQVGYSGASKGFKKSYSL